MSARSTLRSLGHSRQARDLRGQLQGLVPDDLKPAAEAVAHQAGDGMRTLMDYLQLAAEYRQPIVALAQRLLRGAPAAAAPVMPKARRRSNWRPILAIGLVAGIGVIAYSMAKTRRTPARDA